MTFLLFQLCVFVIAVYIGAMSIIVDRDHGFWAGIISGLVGMAALAGLAGLFFLGHG